MKQQPAIATFNEKENKILDAAQRQFATYGYTKVTMDDIADDLGVVKGSLYYYFSNKEAVYRAVVQREQNNFLAHLASELQATSSASEKLRCYFRLRIAFTTRLFNLNQLNREIIHNLKPMYNSLFVEFSKFEQAYLVQILNEGKKSGEFDFLSAPPLAVVINHALFGLRQWVVHHSDRTTGQDEQTLTQDTNLFFEILLSGLKTRNELKGNTSHGKKRTNKKSSSRPAAGRSPRTAG